MLEIPEPWDIFKEELHAWSETTLGERERERERALIFAGIKAGKMELSKLFDIRHETTGSLPCQVSIFLWSSISLFCPDSSLLEW